MTEKRNFIYHLLLPFTIVVEVLANEIRQNTNKTYKL